ncbi:myosin heavy chain [Fusarium albosuccineum]|uniref:Myosin heavy chain n=1 Tax=Fusarium albosuccineum TaxID=1237068 RepID=A0A8H4PFM5_9HYPO|nr:myosin heavy chain [Fusarium albosuccineum]
MVQPDFGGALDTPRTNIGDATYLSRQPDFADISQEASFQSPPKEGNLLQQLRNGRSNGINLRTPRQRGPLADRRNLPPSVGGAEFTPLLKSATRNSVRRYGKENGTAVPNTPALDKIDEADLTPVPRMDTSIYMGSRNQSYMENTMPEVDTSSAASTPMAVPRRRGGDKGPLQDGNQLSLREQENVIDRIEKENFGLKLKIHFLEEALRKAGPGFSEAALKENTELKVDKVTMQRELHRYKKHLTTAEKDLESYRQQMLELQDKTKRKYADQNQQAEMDKLRRLIEDREADIEDLQRQLDQQQGNNDQVEKLQDDIGDLEADLREKDRLLTEREDELEDLKDQMDNLKDKVGEAEEKAKDAQRKMLALEEKAQHSEELEDAKDTIQDLEHNIRRLEEHVEDAKTKMEQAVSEKERAENDLEELQDEMANKSVVTKGLSRQIEEKVARLQEDLDRSGQEYAALEKDHTKLNQEKESLQSTVKELKKSQDKFDRERESLSSRIEQLEADLYARSDDKNVLQSRHDTLASESKALQREVEKLEKEVQDLEDGLTEEREHALEIEKDIRSQYKIEMDRLNDEISDLQAEIREKDNLYDNDSEKWETEKQTLESERKRAEEKAAGLQRTIDRLKEAEGTLSDKESKLQVAIQSEAERHRSEEGVLTRQIEDLQDALETRQALLTNLRNELSTVRDELRQTQIDYQSQARKVTALEDEVDVLQTTLDEEQGAGRYELEAAKRECDDLRDQLKSLRQRSNSSQAASSQALNREIDDLKEQLRMMRQKADELEAANLEIEDLKEQLKTMRQRANTSEAADREIDDLKQQLRTLRQRANMSETASREIEDLKEQLRAVKQRANSSEATNFEIEDLKEQLATWRQRAESAQAEIAASEQSAQQSTESVTRLKWQLSDANAQLDKIAKEKQSLQDQVAKINLELHSVNSSLAEVKAERDELDGELRRAKLYDNETLRVDQERLDLRTAKLKLDNEVRRLKDENKALVEQREAVEKTLEDEIEKAAEEEERLGQEIIQLQNKLRQSSSSENYDLAAARRTIRELERRVDDYENQLNTRQIPGNIEGNSELSMIRKDLSAARQKELDFLQKESANRDVVKGLKRQIADLERQVHETEVSRLIASPRSSISDSGRKTEVAELRNQLSVAQKSIHDLRTKNRDADRKAMQASQDLQRQLNDLEDQKIVLEEVLEEARQQAEETAAQHERALRKMKHQLDKAERERNAMASQQTGISKQDRQLRKNQAEMENLEHDVRQQQELIDNLVASEASLRRKLERARSERAAFRMSAEKLQKDLERIKASAVAAKAESSERRRSSDRMTLETIEGADQALETVIRAAESAEERHKKELRGMVMQMEWMQARFQREASLRADAAYAKKFLQLQLDVANACNKAQLRELEDIRTNLLGNKKALTLPSHAAGANSSTTKPSLRTFLVMARFIARTRLSAQNWAKQEKVRRRLVVATEEQRKVKRSRQLKVVRAEA